jgi:hypothetical protein
MGLRVSGRAEAVLIALAILLPRCLLIATVPWFGGDSGVYATVAANILHHGCVSLSPPEAAACVPHWGGNQLPGYPAFIAVAWWLGAEWRLAPLFGQAMVLAAAGSYLVHSLRLGGIGGLQRALVVAVLVVSPTHVGWSRILFTETLAVASVLWIIAVLVRSVAEQRLRAVELGIAVAAAVFVRYTSVVALVPMLVFLLQSRPPGLHKGLLVAALVAALPLAAWAARSTVLGLTPFVPGTQSEQGVLAPPGLMAWLNTWVSNETQLIDSVWPAAGGRYESIYVPAGQRAMVVPLLQELAAGDPARRAAADVALADWARQERARDPVGQRIVLPATRAAWLWFNPIPSLGLPAEVPPDVQRDAAAAIRGGEWVRVLALGLDNGRPLATKTLSAAWRYAVVAMIAVATCLLWRRRKQLSASLAELLVLSGVVFAVAMTLALVFRPMLETRYLVPVFAWLEVAAALWLGHRWQRPPRPRLPAWDDGVVT